MDTDEIQDPSSAKGNVQVISRAAAILRTLASHPGGLSLAAIAKEVDLPRSTVQRLVTALEGEELLDAKGPTGGTRLGPAMGHFLAAAHSDMIVFGRNYLKRLVDTVAETTSVICTVGDLGMVLESFTSDHPLRVVLTPGTQHPLYATAGGKALLAFHQDKIIDQLYAEDLAPCTHKTIPTRSALKAEIEAVRQNRIAYAREEQSPGLSTIAIAADSPMGLYAFEVALPDVRFDEKREAIETALIKYVEIIDVFSSPHASPHP